MTMVNAWVEPRFALVGVDTLGKKTHWHEGEIVSKYDVLDSDKVYLQPVKRLLMVNRGTHNFLRLFFNVCEIADCDYDDVVRRFPELIEATLGMLNHEVKEGKRDPEAECLQELTVIGWSNELQSFRGTKRYRDQEGGEFKTADFAEGGYGYAAPCRPEWWPCPVKEFSSQTKMIELARWQMKMHQKRPEPDRLIGGRLQIIEMTRNRFSIRTDIELG